MSDEGVSEATPIREAIELVRDGIADVGTQAASAMRKFISHIDQLQARLDAAERERDALREALRRYGQCSYSCASNVVLTSLPPKRQPCDCGYRAALTANHSAPVVEE